MQTEHGKIEPCPYCGGTCTIVNSIRGEAVCVYCPFVDCRYRGADKPTNLEAISAHNTLCRLVKSGQQYEAEQAFAKDLTPAIALMYQKENAVLREQVAKLEKEAVKQAIEIKNLWNTLPTIQTVFAGDSTYCCCGLDCGGSSCMCSICGDGPGCHTDDCPWSAESEEEADRRWELPKYMAIRLSRAEAYSEYATGEIERLEQITNKGTP